MVSDKEPPPIGGKHTTARLGAHRDLLDDLEIPSSAIDDRHCATCGVGDEGTAALDSNAEGFPADRDFIELLELVTADAEGGDRIGLDVDVK